MPNQLRADAACKLLARREAIPELSRTKCSVASAGRLLTRAGIAGPL